jgi:glutathione S-transferase
MSATSDLWGLETTTDSAVFQAKRSAVGIKFGRVEAALGDGPYFAGEWFSLVDAVFGPCSATSMRSMRLPT